MTRKEEIILLLELLKHAHLLKLREVQEKYLTERDKLREELKGLDNQNGSASPAHSL